MKPRPRFPGFKQIMLDDGLEPMRVLTIASHCNEVVIPQLLQVGYRERSFRRSGILKDGIEVWSEQPGWSDEI